MRYLSTCDRFFLDSPGGGYRVAWELARRAAQAGHEAVLVCGSMETDPPEGKELVEGVTVVRYRFPKLGAIDPRRLSAHVAAARRAIETHLLGRWDVVHSHMVTGGLAAFEAAGQGARKVATIHSPAVLEQGINWNNGRLSGAVKRVFGMSLLRRAERKLYEQAEHLITLSNFTAGAIRDLYGEEVGRKLRVLPWWGSAEASRESVEVARRRLGWAPEIPALLTVRRMVPRMGLGLLVEVLQELARRAWRFQAILCGDGPEQELLKRRASAGPARDLIAFPGRLSEEDLRLAYAAADLFLLPTAALEGFGIIAVEALSAGCPVVASRVGAIPEVVGPVLSNCLFEPGRGGELLALLESFLRGTLRTPPREHLRRYARERFDQGRLAGLWLSEILGASPEEGPPSGLPRPEDQEGWVQWVKHYGSVAAGPAVQRSGSPPALPGRPWESDGSGSRP
jgi:glycosyltransferase involved in cell wall biosynthesis